MTHIHQEHLYPARERSLADPSARLGFASTAAYFETTARKERRDQERRERLMEPRAFIAVSLELFPAYLQGTRAIRQCCL